MICAVCEQDVQSVSKQNGRKGKERTERIMSGGEGQFPVGDWWEGALGICGEGSCQSVGAGWVGWHGRRTGEEMPAPAFCEVMFSALRSCGQRKRGSLAKAMHAWTREGSTRHGDGRLDAGRGACSRAGDWSVAAAAAAAVKLASASTLTQPRTSSRTGEGRGMYGWANECYVDAHLCFAVCTTAGEGRGVEGDAVHVLLLREGRERAGEARERDELLCAGLLGGHWKMRMDCLDCARDGVALNGSYWQYFSVWGRGS